MVIIDFDGTLTERDGDLAIAEALLGPERIRSYHAIASAYERLELSTREFFTRYVQLLGFQDPREPIARAASAIRFRPGARQLLGFCADAGLHTIIASEGLDAYVVAALAAHGIAGAEVSCNRLIVEQGVTSVLPAPGAEPCDRCLSCKASHVRRAHARGEPVVVVGDGASDLCGAREADLVLARGSLLAHCAREAITCTAWDSLSDVLEQIRKRGQEQLPSAGYAPDRDAEESC